MQNCAKAGPYKVYLSSAEALASWLGRALQGGEATNLSKTLRRIWSSPKQRQEQRDALIKTIQIDWAIRQRS